MVPLDEGPGAHGGGGGDGGVDDGVDGLAVAGEGGAAVEAEPAEPEHAGAESDEGAVVGDVHHEALLFGEGGLVTPAERAGGVRWWCDVKHTRWNIAQVGTEWVGLRDVQTCR